jgi:hypothetical protein
MKEQDYMLTLRILISVEKFVAMVLELLNLMNVMMGIKIMAMVVVLYVLLKRVGVH